MLNQSETGQELSRIHSYRDRPAQWLVDFIGIRPETLWWSLNPGYEDHSWDSKIKFPGEREWQSCPNPLVALLRAWAAGYKQIACQSATGTGKTFTMSGGVLHYLDTHRPSIVKTYAPTADTLEDQLFGYMGEMFNGVEGGEGFGALHPKAVKHNDMNVYMDPDSDNRVRWSASGEAVETTSGDQASFDADSAAGAQGSHAEWMTLIIEEAPGVHPRIWNALDFTVTDSKNQIIAYGNPDSENDPLNKFAERDSTLVIRVSGLDHPNYVTGERVVPGAFGKDQPERLLEKYNGDEAHPMYKSRVRGICPRVAGSCLFKDKALRAVQDHFRVGDPEGKSLKELEWKDPLFQVPHTADDWREALLRLARSGGWGEDTFGDKEGAPSVEDYAREEALGIYDIEGHTEIYAAPKFDQIGRYVLGLDVAGDYAEGDAHAGILFDRISQHVVAEIHLRGPREAYALAALALARVFRVPHIRDVESEEQLEEKGAQQWIYERYIEHQREVQKNPTELEWPGRQGSYPKIAWETNGVGALHKVGPFKAYPNLYYDKNPDVQGAKRSRRMGWQTTTGKTGTRKEMVENLRDWHHLLAFEPEGCPSEGLVNEMSSFKKNKDRDRYEAETGEHDDRVMGQGICLSVSERIADPTETKRPTPARNKPPRNKRPTPDDQRKSVWGVPSSSSGVWGV